MNSALRPLPVVAVLVLSCGLAWAEDALSADARVGTVLDLQGRALVRPVGASRWSPLAVDARLEVGDLVRTPARGANALQVELPGGGGFVLGPGALLEISGKRTLHLLAGDLEVTPGAKGEAAGEPVEVTGPGDFARSAGAPIVLRALRSETLVLETAPRWLDGYHASTSDEWMGSLIANVDGRDVPLTVGYHSVRVDIRDQIARTVIEETFQNHTISRLEGVFYFPLPADASISGFGMWIGGELVEADIVEKQRAREIYETILRERRDPGLLEWSGGNLFKARVFPIEGHSEKRIKISYTQVLPLEGDSYRYRYALRSELLRKNPLRQLEMQVRVDSAVPLESLRCTSHEARVRVTDRNALCEFSAEEYSPDRDFEVIITPQRAGRDLVAVPHRRGEDGYFMLQLTPPASDGGWKRELLPEGEPLDLVMMIDSSGSMDEQGRAVQVEMLEAMLELLGERDRVRILTVDTVARWIERAPVAVDAGRIEGILAALAARPPLGWTDLGAGFTALAGESLEGAHIVYLGDGIPTSGDADSVALLARLEELVGKSGAAFHAVAPGSTYDRSVLEGISRLAAGGSSRVITDSPAVTAQALLAEIAQPTLRDMELEFDGLRVARVYPERLPNLASGRQLIILGRYLPTGAAQRGTVTVRGTYAGEPVSFVTELSLQDGEEGNSFLPRLWARNHIEALLDGGRTAEVRQQVIAYSEEFGIMTPFTSFLVLESDEDRKRFGVERRVRMRDGEQFFAEGADRAQKELARQQMLAASAWRAQLRRSTLQELARLDRDPGRFLQVGAHAPGSSSGFGLRYAERDTREQASRSRLSSMTRYDFGGGPEGEAIKLGEVWESDHNESAGDEFGSADDAPSDGSELADSKGEYDADDGEFEPLDELEETARALAKNRPYSQPMEPSSRYERAASMEALDRRAQHGPGGWRAGEQALTISGNLRMPADIGRMVGATVAVGGWAQSYLLFAPEPPVAQAALPEEWPAAVRELAEHLARDGALQSLGDGGLAARQRTESLAPQTGRATGWSEELVLVGSSSWLSAATGEGRPAVTSWCAGGERALASSTLGVGNRRDAVAADRTDYPVPVRDNAGARILDSYRGYDARLEEGENGLVVVVLTQKITPAERVERERWGGRVVTAETRLYVDRERRVVVRLEFRSGDELVTTIEHGELVELAGRWWATRSVVRDGEGKVTSVTTLQIESVTPADLEQPMKDARAASWQEELVWLRGVRLPSVDEAKQAVLDGGEADGFEARLVLALHFSATNQWDRAGEEWRRAATSIAGKPLHAWLTPAFLAQSGRLEELRAALAALVERALVTAEGADLYVAQIVLQWASRFQADEVLAELEKLAPVFQRGRLAEVRRHNHLLQLAQWTRSAGRLDAAVALYEQIAREHPDSAQSWLSLAGILRDAGGRDRAVEVLAACLDRKEAWTAGERSSLFRQLVQLHTEQGDLEAGLACLQEWIQERPTEAYPCERLLAMLLQSDEEAELDLLIARWLSLAAREGALEDWELPRLRSAIGAALGDFRDFRNFGSMLEEWVESLATCAKALLEREDTAGAEAFRILGDHRFRSQDAFREIRDELLAALAAKGAGMDLARVENIFAQVDWRRQQVSDDVALRVAAILLARWEAMVAAVQVGKGGEATPEQLAEFSQADRVAELLLRLWDMRGESDLAIPFARQRVDAAPTQERHRHARALFWRLLSRPHTPALDDELWSLVEQMQPPMPTDEELLPAAELDRLFDRIALVLRLADAIPPKRASAAAAADESRKGLSRTAQRQAAKEDLRAARRAVAQTLQDRARDSAADLRPWMLLEAVGLRALLGDDALTLEAEVREILGSLPAPPTAQEEERGPVQPAHALDPWMRSRGLTILAYLAARQGAPEELVERLAADLRHGDEGELGQIDWRWHRARLLFALDRAESLEAALRGWIDPEKAVTRWRVWLSYLLAETGRLAEAIGQLEQVEREDELTPADYQRLAGWYLATSRDEERSRAIRRRWDTTAEWSLSSELSNRFYREYQRDGDSVPAELDAEIPLMFRSLLARAENPANHTWLIAQYYQALKDFRLLSCVPDGVLGHTINGIYPFLQNLQSVLGNIHEEATCDQLLARLAELRAREGLTATDRRALDHLECLVERTAAKVLNQPGPHAERALAAMRAAFKGEWQPGEPKLLSAFLASLGALEDETLAAEQLRQMHALWRLAPEGSSDRLGIARDHALLLLGYERAGDAIAILEPALEEYRQALGGKLSYAAGNAINTLVTAYEADGRSQAAERLLESEIAAAADSGWRYSLTYGLLQLYERCIREGRRLSLGQDAALYEGARDRVRLELARQETQQLASVLDALVAIHRAERDRAIEQGRKSSSGADLEKWASEQFFALARGQTEPWSYQRMVSAVSGALDYLNGPTSALSFLVTALEVEPGWFARAGYDGWDSHSWQLGHFVQQHAATGQLAERLLALATDFLRRRLRALGPFHHAVISQQSGYFWNEKADDFARVAELVLEERPDSEAVTVHCASYIYSGLVRPGRAIEVMQGAHARGLLGDGNQGQLCRWLHEQGRYRESLELLRGLVARRADTIEYRVMLMVACHDSGLLEELVQVLDSALEHFRVEKLWNESVLAAIASASLRCELHERAIVFYRELIPLHQETHANRGIGDGVLSSYYAQLAAVLSGLGRTHEAVEAACGAIVSWGHDVHNRTNAVESLRQSLANASDLVAYAEAEDARVEATGVDSPLVRKSLGAVLLDKGKPALAAHQLRKALELQDADAETHRLLVAALDAAEEPAEAIAALRRAVALSRQDLELARSLAKRLAEAGDEDEAERAITQVVEALPEETESHVALAKHREEQGVLDAAITQWRHVARLREREPTGLLGLTRVLTLAGHKDEARVTLRALEKADWPERFKDVRDRIDELRAALR